MASDVAIIMVTDETVSAAAAAAPPVPVVKKKIHRVSYAPEMVQEFPSRSEDGGPPAGSAPPRGAASQDRGLAPPPPTPPPRLSLDEARVAFFFDTGSSDGAASVSGVATPMLLASPGGLATTASGPHHAKLLRSLRRVSLGETCEIMRTALSASEVASIEQIARLAIRRRSDESDEKRASPRTSVDDGASPKKSEPAKSRFGRCSSLAS